MSNRLLRKQARRIFQAALTAADPAGAVAAYLKRRDYSRYRNIYVIGAGKAGATGGSRMATFRMRRSSSESPMRASSRLRR